LGPTSGYLTRQLYFSLNNYVYRSEGEDEKNACILIPRYRTEGRVAPNGSRYPKFTGKGDESDLVPVRSIITKFAGDKSIVTPDLIGITKPAFRDITDGTAIGISFATSMTESITQSILGLKHGGHERVLDKSGFLTFDKPCTFREEGKWIYLKVRGGEEFKFPRPDNIVTLGKNEFAKGENICCAYNTSSPIYKPNSLIKLMIASQSSGIRYYEKDNIVISDCYAYEDGVIKYTEDSRTGDIDVTVGKHRYRYNPNCMYYFPDGATVKKFDRICSGLVNMRKVADTIGDNIQDIYLIFRKQFYTLLDAGFVKKGVLADDVLGEELIELLFSGLTKVDIDVDDLSVNNVEYIGNSSSIDQSDSFFTRLSFGYASKVIKSAVAGNTNVNSDVFTDTILGLLLTNKLDQ
jgi:hypothetical protein